MAWFNVLKLILSGIFFVSLPFALEAGETLTVRADSWCPYNCEPRSKPAGIMIEMLEEIFGKNMTIDYQVIPWTQAVADVRTGRFDVVLAIAESDSVGLIHTEKAQAVSINCAYGLESSKIQIASSKDLRKLQKIGVAKNYSYGEATDAVLKEPSMKTKVSSIGSSDPLPVNIRRVLDGKIEAVLEDENVMSYQIKLKNIKGLKKLGCTEDRTNLWIGFTASNPKSKEWVDALDKGQSKLENSGKLSEIYKRYDMKPL